MMLLRKGWCKKWIAVALVILQIQLILFIYSKLPHSKTIKLKYYLVNSNNLTTSESSNIMINELNHTCDLPVKNVGTLLAQRFPHFIIIGFGKAGTRAVYQMIRMHPDVVGPSYELRFFSTDSKYKQGINAYVKSFPTTTITQKTIEKSPDYIIKPGTAERIKRALIECHRYKDIMFIVVLREPVRRAISEYLEWQYYVKNVLKKDLKNFKKLALKKSGRVNNLRAQVNASIYSYHIRNWLKVFDKKMMCFVDGNLLVKNPYYVMKNLESCLKLRDFLTPKNFYFSERKGFYCAVDASGLPQCLGANKGRKHPEIDKDLELKLQLFYQSYNEELYNITGMNFTWV